MLMTAFWAGHSLVDSAGLPVHVRNPRKPPKDRNWRKLDMTGNAFTGELIASELSSPKGTIQRMVQSVT